MRLCLVLCTESSDTPMTASSPHCAAAAAAAAAVTSSVTSDRRHSSISAVSCSNSSSARQHAPPSSSERLAVADGPSCLCLVFVLSQQIVVLVSALSRLRLKGCTEMVMAGILQGGFVAVSPGIKFGRVRRWMQ